MSTKQRRVDCWIALGLFWSAKARQQGCKMSSKKMKEKFQHLNILRTSHKRSLKIMNFKNYFKINFSSIIIIFKFNDEILLSVKKIFAAEFININEIYIYIFFYFHEIIVFLRISCQSGTGYPKNIKIWILDFQSVFTTDLGF